MNALSHPFIHLFNKYLRNVYSVRGPVSGSGDEVTDESSPISVLMGTSGTLVGGASHPERMWRVELDGDQHKKFLLPVS